MMQSLQNNIRDRVEFAKKVLGLPLHAGQIHWLQNSQKLVNILKPANQWGKTTVESVEHIYQAICKPQLDRFNMDFDTWLNTRYETLNFGKTYEVAKGVMEHIIDIVEGRYLLPDGTFNKSLLKGGAIVRIDDMPRLPRIVWITNSVTLIRSYDGLGESFKRKRLAFVGGDECGDIPELNLFLTGTLMPRVFFYQGSIHLVGTSQPKGIEYEEITTQAEEDMKKNKDSRYFVLSAGTNAQMASVYQNDFMPKEHIRQIEQIADPELRKQIIYGMYVDWSKHLYSWEEVRQMFQKDIPYNEETGYSEAPIENEYYAFATDLAASEDWTSVTCIRYNIRSKNADGTFKYYPHRIAFHKSWKGSSLPLSLQYAMIKTYFKTFKDKSPLRSKFIFDAGSLGGKNAAEAFKDLGSIYPFPPKGRSYAEIKAEAMGKVKEVLSRSREFVISENGDQIDKDKEWGGIKASIKLKELRRQIEIASKDDEKIRNDEFSSFMMALHFIEARAPKIVHTKAVDFNFSRLNNARFA